MEVSLSSRDISCPQGEFHVTQILVSPKMYTPSQPGTKREPFHAVRILFQLEDYRRVLPQLVDAAPGG